MNGLMHARAVSLSCCLSWPFFIMLIFLLQSSLVLSILFLLYCITLRGTTLHSLSRTVLSLIVLCSLLLPACRVKLSDGNRMATRFHHMENTVRHTLSPTSSPQHVRSMCLQHEEPAMQEKPIPFTLGDALLLIYILASGFLLLRYLLALARYVQLIRQSQRAFRVGKVRVYTHPGIASPISWGRTVVLSPDDLHADFPVLVDGTSCHRHSPLLRHELAHIRLFHTLDRLLCDVFVRFLWFCPFSWLLRAELEALHEFQADAYVVRDGMEQDAYSALLVQKATHPLPLCAVHGWHASQIKHRLRMLYALRSHPAAGWRALILLPAVCVMTVCLAVPSKAVHVMQQVLPPVTAPVNHVQFTQSLPSADPAEAITEPSRENQSTFPADVEAEENTVHYVSRRLTTESIAELAHSFGLPEEAGYSSIVTIDGLTDAAVQYRVDDTPCDAATFARHASVHFDEAHRTVWAFGKKGCHRALKAVPRLHAQQLYGVDAEVLVVYTQTAPPASPPVQRTMVVDGTDLYTVTSVYQADTSFYNKET